jgi:hypothetical protein
LEVIKRFGGVWKLVWRAKKGCIRGEKSVWGGEKQVKSGFLGND